MSFDPKPFSEYASTVEKTLATGHASEGSYYPTLKALLQLYVVSKSETIRHGEIADTLEAMLPGSSIIIPSYL